MFTATRDTVNIASPTDTVNIGFKKITHSASSTILALVVCTNITQYYSLSNLNSLITDKTASNINQNLDGSIITLSNSGTNNSIYTLKNFEFNNFHEETYEISEDQDSLVEDLMILSESGLDEFWLAPGEEEAWKNLMDK